MIETDAVAYEALRDALSKRVLSDRLSRAARVSAMEQMIELEQAYAHFLKARGELAESRFHNSEILRWVRQKADLIAGTRRDLRLDSPTGLEEETPVTDLRSAKGIWTPGQMETLRQWISVGRTLAVDLSPERSQLSDEQWPTGGMLRDVRLSFPSKNPNNTDAAVVIQGSQVPATTGWIFQVPLYWIDAISATDEPALQPQTFAAAGLEEDEASLDERAKRIQEEIAQRLTEAGFLLPKSGLEEKSLRVAVKSWSGVMVTPAYPKQARTLLPVFTDSRTFHAIPLFARGGLPFLAISRSGLEEQGLKAFLDGLKVDPKTYRIWRLDEMNAGLEQALALARELFHPERFVVLLVSSERPDWLRGLLAGLEQAGVLPLDDATAALQQTERYLGGSV